MALLRLFTFTWKETKAKEKHFLVGKKLWQKDELVEKRERRKMPNGSFGEKNNGMKSN